MAASPVDQIKQRLSIIDVVSSYTKLQKAGKHFKGKSPFTNERTPSFFVSPERGMYYCFSTNKGGDIFTFIQEMEGVDFRGALKILAEKAGVELTPIDPKVKDDREKLFSLMEEATKYFVRERRARPEIHSYLLGRGLKDETIDAWSIGYALPEWRGLRDYLLTLGYTDELMYRAGVLKKAEAGKNGYDVFRNRVMFPIRDSSGRVVGFSGRTLEKDPATPKYVNSPETELFEKSYVLFGYDKAKQGIRTYDFSLVVEGQFDLVLSHQAGYTNAVAISGTALTAHHVELLSRLSNRVVLALDSDVAGINSAKRSATLMLGRGMDVKVARIMGGKDPADLVREDPKLLKYAVGSATHIVEFMLEVVKASSKDDRNFKLRVREEVVPFLTMIPSAIDREHFEQLVATRIGTTHDAIRQEVQHAMEAAKQAVPANDPSMQKAPAEAKIEPRRAEDIITYLYGLLLSAEEDKAPKIDAAGLRKGLELALGRGSMQSLEDWAVERKNEAIFKAEALYTDEGDVRIKAQEMLYELYMGELRRRLKEGREQLAVAERKGETTPDLLKLCNDLGAELKTAMGGNPFKL